MGGIYFHIPFCRHKCLYCNFFSVANTSQAGRVVAAMRRELAERRKDWPDNDIRTVYFGGGTPSVLPADDIAAILEDVRSSFSTAQDMEVTLEANPDDVSAEKVRMWRAAGVNRVSLGVQSFDTATLAAIGRRHSGNDALRAVDMLHRGGFENITLDIIYGIPGRGDEILADDLHKALYSDVKHVSAYALTVEPGTALDVLIRRGKMSAPDDGDAARQFLLVKDTLETAGMEHYEISNFAFPGFRSRHNSAYWQGKPYLGIGPSAHSFDGKRERRWNTASAGGYVTGIGGGGGPWWESEELSEKDRHNEMIMTALRTCEGLPTDVFADRFGGDALSRLMKSAEKYIGYGTAEIKDGHLRLTRTGLFFADGIAADFFYTD